MRTAEQKRVDELYETCCLLMEELGVKMAQLQVAVMKIGRPETTRLKYAEGSGKVEFTTPEGVALPDPKEILRIACDTLSQRVEDVMGRQRYRELVDLRYITIKLIKDLYGDGITLKEIGRVIGNRDHSTVLHAICEASELYHVDTEFRHKHLQVELALRSKFNQLSNHKINQNG